MSLDRDNLEAWLTEHPEANDDLVDLPNLRAMYQSVWPTEPDEAAYNAVQARIHESIVQGLSPRQRRPRLGRAIVGLTAASVVLAALLTRSLWMPSVPTPPTVVKVEEPFPVVDPEDVTILAMDARDVAALVVGEPPVWGDLEFARPEDIHVIRCERCPHSGRLARLEREGEVPMFVSATVEPPDDD
jgi:hypothetical protein